MLPFEHESGFVGKCLTLKKCPVLLIILYHKDTFYRMPIDLPTEAIQLVTCRIVAFHLELTMAEPAPPAKIGPNHDQYRDTPRSLCRTLYTLRVVGEQKTMKITAEELGWSSPVRMSKMENCKLPKLELAIHQVQRYEDLYGIPTSVINGVSQVFAAARDRDDELMEVLGLMFAKLASRLATKPQRDDLVDRVHNCKPASESKVSDLPLSAWDNLLGMLIMDVWGAAPYAKLKNVKKPARLEARRKGSKKIGMPIGDEPLDSPPVGDGADAAIEFGGEATPGRPKTKKKPRTDAVDG